MTIDKKTTAAVLRLVSSKKLQRELAQIQARATLRTLGADEDRRWAYRSDRVVRNIVAIQEVLLAASQESGGAGEVSRSAKSLAEAWEALSVLEAHVPAATALLNASIAYELAGYQANAACLARRVTHRD